MFKAKNVIAVNFEHISHSFPVFLLLTFNRYMFAGENDSFLVFNTKKNTWTFYISELDFLLNHRYHKKRFLWQGFCVTRKRNYCKK